MYESKQHQVKKGARGCKNLEDLLGGCLLSVWLNSF